jgi:predicted acetyltransferase
LSIEIRPVPEASLRQWANTVNLAFGEHMTDEHWAIEGSIVEADRVLGAYDGERLVGGGGAYSLQLTVPGARSVPTAGVTAVGVLPTHRRQGILTQLMRRQLLDVRERGEPLAVLWASEGAIYQRFGYGLGTLTSVIDIERSRAAFRTTVTPRGAMRMVDIDTARQLMPAVFDVVGSTVPGFVNRAAGWWDTYFADLPRYRDGASEKFHVVHERDGRVVGYVSYRVKDDWSEAGPASTLIVLELLGTDPSATAQLWRFVFGVDLIARITARRGPADHPLLLLLAEPRRAGLRLGDGLWLRIVDVPGALASRRYERDGGLVLQVADDFMPDWAGTWRLTVNDGEGRVEPASGQADLRVDTNDLAAVYLGAFTFADLGRAGRTHELKPGAWARADALFTTSVPPWCPVMF